MPKRRVRAESYPVGTRVPKQYLEEIERLVKQGHYLDIADYLRDVIRRDLEQRGLMPTGQPQKETSTADKEKEKSLGQADIRKETTT